VSVFDTVDQLSVKLTYCARLFWPFHASVADAALNRIESDRVSTDTPLKLDSLKPWYEWKDKLHKEHGLSFRTMPCSVRIWMINTQRRSTIAGN